MKLLWAELLRSLFPIVVVVSNSPNTHNFIRYWGGTRPDGHWDLRNEEEGRFNLKPNAYASYSRRIWHKKSNTRKRGKGKSSVKERERTEKAKAKQ